MTVTILEVGDPAIPVVNADYLDPVTDTEMTFPTQGIVGTVLKSETYGNYVESDEPIYQYLLTFDPPVETTADVVTADDDGIETSNQQLFTASEIWFSDVDLGLSDEVDPFELDSQAIQNTIDEGKQRSTANLSTVQSISASVGQEDVVNTSDYGGPDILASSDTLTALVGTLDNIEDVNGKTSDEIDNQAYKYEKEASSVADNSDIFAEYVDNLYSQRQVEQEKEDERHRYSEQGAEQQQQADVEDAQNSKEYYDAHIDLGHLENPFTLTENFDEYNLSEEAEETLLDSIEEVVNNLNSSLLGPDDPAPTLFTIERTTSTVQPEPESTSYPTSPEEAEE